MKSTPMLMSGPLVVPTLADLKTHTCRPVMLPRSYDHDEIYSTFVDGAVATLSCDPGPHRQVRCPFGTVGDRIWIRETWQVVTGSQAGDLGAAVRYRDMSIRACWMPKENPMPLGLTWDRWRPSIHMPKWASRITLEVTSVSVFRVQSASHDVLLREGIWTDSTDPTEGALLARWQQVWTEIYGAESWSETPWVWGIGFKRVQE